MDWNNLTPIQLLALGAQTAKCWAAETGCEACPFSEKNGEASCESICGLWSVEHPEEALELCGVAVAQMEDNGVADLREHRNRLVNSVDKLQRTVKRLQGENADQTAALAEALSAKEALEVDLGDLRAVNDQLREENADLLKDRDETDAELEKVRAGLHVQEDIVRKLRNDLEETEQAYFQEKGRADGLLEALKIVHGSQT